MGVSGLWDVISPAERKYSLEELALHRSSNRNKNLRIAIDISIWNIQAKATHGGTNAALRTIFYRCCRLYTLGIRPVFVFDGDQRPAYKRNQHIDTSISNRVEHHLLLGLINLFGFVVWNAAGEAEAECAVLQRLGYVDIVFTADVDIFLFGGQRVARNWPGTDYEPISCIDSDWIEQTTSLDRSDMILMALLSGSDYDSGVNRLGIQASLGLAKLKYHRPILDNLQKLTDTNTYDEQQNYPDDNDVPYNTQLYELMDRLQHELNTNQSGTLRRRHRKVDLKALVENEQFTNLANDWIHPNTAILDPSNTEAAKKMHFLLNDESVTPEFVSLACFCQTQFGWTKATTLDKFAKKLYPGYMLHRTTTWNGTNFIISTEISTTKSLQQTSRRQRAHPYFNKYYNSKDLFYSNKNQRLQQQQPTDLYRIHLIEDLRKTKHGIRSQKLSRCRVEWHVQSLVEFLSMVGKELMDTPNINNNPLNSPDDDDDDDDDDTSIDLTTQQLPPAPAIGPPSLMIPGKNSTIQTQLLPDASIISQPLTTTEANDDSWIYQYCDPSKCCRQWIGSKLVQKVYPKMMNEFTKTHQAKRKKKMRTTMDSTQKRLDNFFTPIHNTDSLTSSDRMENDKGKMDTSTNNNHHTPTAITQEPQQQHLHSGQSLILPIRKKVE